MATPRTGQDIGVILLNMKKQLVAEQEKRAELSGELKGLLKQLSSEYGIESLEEAKTKIENDEKALEKMEESLRCQIERLEEMMEERDV